MEKSAFDALARTVSPLRTRRTALVAASAVMLGLGLGSEHVDAGKKKRRRKKRKKRCPLGSARTGNLCCTYRCSATNPPTFKHYCIDGAIEGTTRCDGSLVGCSFDDASFSTASCAVCGAQ